MGSFFLNNSTVSVAARQGRTLSKQQVGEQAAQDKTNEQVSVESRDRQELTLAVWLSSRKMSAACHECSTVHGSQDIMFPFLSFSLHTLPVQLPPFLTFFLVSQRTSRNKPIYSAEKE